MYIIRIVFSILMLSVFVTNSVLEVVLAGQEVCIELADLSEKDENSKEDKENKDEKENKEEKESKEAEKESKETRNKFRETPLGLIGVVKYKCLQKTRSAYHYADNLQNYSLELDTPPPEWSC